MPRHAPHSPSQRRSALLALVLALLMQALWLPRLAVAQAAGVDVCSAQGHRRIPLPPQEGQPAHHHDGCCCAAAFVSAPPPALAAVPLLAGGMAPDAAPPGASPSLEALAPQSRGPPALPQ